MTKTNLFFSVLLLGFFLLTCSNEQISQKALIDCIEMNPPRISHILGGGAGLFASWVYNGEADIHEIRIKICYLDKNGDILFQEKSSIYTHSGQNLREEQVFSYRINKSYINATDSYRIDILSVEVQ